jgi:glycosyltransferase involved in cell wall biosynthesis
LSIDVIIPCYNAHKTLARCLASVAMQVNIDDVQVTLVNDYSPDGGYEDFVKAFSEIMNIQCINLEENVGPGLARQVGLYETDGRYVVFVDADDTLATAFALQQMQRAMEQYNADVVCGQFMEELEDGSFVAHGENMVWVFGKMYRRNFLDRHLIRFPDSRANEDKAFNSVVEGLTRNIFYIPQTVYCWHWGDGTITRRDDAMYTYDAGQKGYIDGMAWAVKELQRRGVNKEIIRSKAVDELCIMYILYNETLYRKPTFGKQTLEAIQDYWNEILDPMEEHLYPLYLQEHLTKQQKRMADTCNSIVFSITMNDFLKTLREGAKKEVTEQTSSVE